MKKNKYTNLETRLFFNILSKGKVTLKKLANMAGCQYAFLRQREISGKGPIMISLELSNECNTSCLYCRSQNGEIYDINPNGVDKGIPKGVMPYEMAQDIIYQLKDYVLMAVLYTSGEPLVYKRLAELIRFSTRHKVPTMIATNGLLLNKEKGRELLTAGLDFIKIQLSGFTQDIYAVEVRHGNVEKIKDNIKTFVNLNRALNSKAVILLDYILYNYNRHQLPSVVDFCDKLGIGLNVRPGNPRGGLESKEKPLGESHALPLSISCDWIWKAMQIYFNGAILPCCEGSIWSGIKSYTTFTTSSTNLLEVWNGPQARAMRRDITTKGRKSIPICAQCHRTGIAFKW